LSWASSCQDKRDLVGCEHEIDDARRDLGESLSHHDSRRWNTPTGIQSTPAPTLELIAHNLLDT
jgi:hypothetical protein